MLVSVYDPAGRTVAMSQVLENLPPPPISVDIPKGEAGRYSSVQKNLQVALKDSKSEIYSGAE